MTNDIFTLLSQDASTLRQMLQQGEMCAVELAQKVLTWIDQVEPNINAFISLDHEYVVAQAQVYDNLDKPRKDLLPLGGIPIAVKDNIDVAGMSTTAGMAETFHRKPQRDAHLVDRIKQAGGIILGKLSMHEAAFGATNANPFFGECHNPHHLGHTPGGSSGGSAAAVAALMTPIAIGSDTLGSIRIPASYCGVFGFKPSFGLVSTAGTIPVSRQLDHFGPLARSVSDLQLTYRALIDYDPDDANSRKKLPEEALGNYANLRVGYVEPADLADLEPAVLEAYSACIDDLHRLPFHCQSVNLSDIDSGSLRRAALLLCEADMLAYYDSMHDSVRDLSTANFSPDLRAMLDWASKKSASDLMRASLQLDQVKRRFQRLFADLDFLMLPTTFQQAFSFDEPIPTNQADLTCFANIAGSPAISLPLTRQGLPCGIQVMAGYQRDEALLAFSAFLSQELGLAFKPAQNLS